MFVLSPGIQPNINDCCVLSAFRLRFDCVLKPEVQIRCVLIVLVPCGSLNFVQHPGIDLGPCRELRSEISDKAALSYCGGGV